MATNKDTLKSYFRTGFRPTQQNFEALIDSFLHKNDTTDQGGTELIDQCLKIGGSITLSTSATASAAEEDGTIRFNNGVFEGYINGNWQPLGNVRYNAGDGIFEGYIDSNNGWQPIGNLRLDTNDPTGNTIQGYVDGNWRELGAGSGDSFWIATDDGEGIAYADGKVRIGSEPADVSPYKFDVVPFYEDEPEVDEGEITYTRLGQSVFGARGLEFPAEQSVYYKNMLLMDQPDVFAIAQDNNGNIFLSVPNDGSILFNRGEEGAFMLFQISDGEAFMQVIGDLSVSNDKNFKIDHPLDPENKFLLHTCIESNERKTIYSGSITTNEDGLATVQLPDYFEALNKNHQYQLTVANEFAQAIIKSKVENNKFVIATDKPNIEVYWQVTGTRNDVNSKVRPFKVEVDKAQSERGLYIHPKAFNKSEDASIFKAKDVKKKKHAQKKKDVSKTKKS